MLVSITATVFALAAISAARPGASVLRTRDDIIGPSAAFQIKQASPDQTFNLGGSSDNSGGSSSSSESSSSTEFSSSSIGSSSSTVSSSSTNATTSTSPDAHSSPTGISLLSSLPFPTGASSLISALHSMNTSISAGGAASTSGFKIGYMRARHAEKIHDIDDIFTNLKDPKTRNLEDFITSLEARQVNSISTSMPSATSASSTTSSLLSLPSVTSMSSIASSLLSLPNVSTASSTDSSDSSMPSFTSATSTDSSTSSAASPSVTNQGGIAFEFKVSQDAGNTNNVDLVVSFTNLPCDKSPGPFSFEFNFVPDAGYSSTGEGQINVFKVNGNLGGSPTYNTVDAATGSLIGTFELPTGSDANQPKLIFINQLVCEPTINLRFGITQYSSSAGAVAYFNRNGMGLRERSG